MTMQPLDILRWYVDAGVDEAISEQPRDYFAPPRPSSATAAPAARHPAPPQEEQPDMARTKAKTEAEPKSGMSATPASMAPASAAPARPSLATMPPSAAIAEARTLADAAATREQLEHAVRNFEGCALKTLATNTVFSDGNPNAAIMLIGEAPGAQEDAQGIPFCGPSGQLLDKMFASIGLDRNGIYITNTIFWRPPGNRQPSKEELAICQPFVQKHIALIAPKLLILSGGTAVSAILGGNTGISKLRGKFHEYRNEYMDAPVPVGVIFHPSYLLRSPGQKKLAWQDMLLIRRFIAEHGIKTPRT